MIDDLKFLVFGESTVKIEVNPNSKFEEFVVKKLCPLSKEKPIRRLGVLFGEEFNTYTIVTSGLKALKLRLLLNMAEIVKLYNR